MDEFDEPIEEETDRTMAIVSAAVLALILAQSSDGQGGGRIDPPPTGWAATIAKATGGALTRFTVRAVDGLRRWAPRRVRDARVLSIVHDVVTAAHNRMADIVEAGWREWGEDPVEKLRDAAPVETPGRPTSPPPALESGPRPSPGPEAVKEATQERLRRIRVDADRAARTGTLSVRERSRFMVATEAGAVYKVWRSRRDNRVRPTHGDLEGNRVPLSNHFITASGASLMYPHDPAAPLHETAGCRCRLSYLVKDNA